MVNVAFWGGPTIAKDANAQNAAIRLFDRYGGEIYEHLYFMVGNKSDAEDLVQETFVRVLESWPSYRRAASERTWVWAIARHCLSEYFRKKRREYLAMTTLTDYLRLHGDIHPVSFPVEIVEALQQLTVAQRHVLICRTVQGLSVRDTAHLLGFSEAKVRVTLHRAVKRLREVWIFDGR
ncbi:MAG: RNA polymerase sigma factor [Firmicutes bacterium]|nr:RNA polymerase sigma factor [Bacillota bacterium]